MLSNYYTLAAVASDLDSKLQGTTIREAFTQEKDELVLLFSDIPGALIISCSADVNTLYLQPNFSRARRNSVDVLKVAAGKSLGSIFVQPKDRVVSLTLENGLLMHAQFFGHKSNALVVNSQSQIVDAFRNARSIVGQSYRPSGGVEVDDVTDLRGLLSSARDDSARVVLKRAYPKLGSTLANEILFRCDLTPTVRAGEITETQLCRLEDSLATVLVELAQPVPRVYLPKFAGQSSAVFSIVNLEHRRMDEEKIFADIHEAIRFFVSRTKSQLDLHSHAKNIVAALQRQHMKLARAIEAVAADLEGTSRAREYEHYGSYIMANLALITKGMKTVTTVDDGTSVTIPLDTKLTPVQNGQRYFEKAKKSRVAYDQAKERLNGLRSSLRNTDTLLTAAESIGTKEELRQFKSEHADELERFGLGEKAKERELLPFRVFSVEGGFEVWAGKSSRNNDELTLKNAKPNDLWFHVRGGSGSHVVLKTNSGNGTPGKKAKEQAAGIAAYYSKMRNAKMVPVAMTERKYVRKPKGAAPGKVVLAREEVIFAEPALPKRES